ncbi:MAG: hypothetical protein ACI9YL_001826 [Luteibaculaceae bacterium]|jgi:outer membrane protein W
MKGLIIFFTLFISGWVNGQEAPASYSKWFIKHTLGLNNPFNALLNNEITDHLLDYDDHSYFTQSFSGNFFFLKNWGAELTFQAGNSGKAQGQAEKFNAELRNIFGTKYFVRPRSGAEYNPDNIRLGSIERVYVGIVYRLEKTRFLLLPKFLVGFTSLYADKGGADLKEKGTNTVLRVSYDPGNRPKKHVSFAPAFTVGYRLSEHLFLNLDLQYSYFKTDIEFIKETRNLYTDEFILESIKYKKSINTLTIGAGLIFEL